MRALRKKRRATANRAGLAGHRSNSSMIGIALTAISTNASTMCRAMAPSSAASHSRCRTRTSVFQSRALASQVIPLRPPGASFWKINRLVQFPFELFAPLPVGGLHLVGGQGRTNAKVPSCRAGAFGLHPNLPCVGW